MINISITTYNRLELTIRAIRSIVEHTKSWDYVISVFDNASSDGTQEYLKRLKDECIIKNLFLSKENVGIAKASNYNWLSEPSADHYIKFDNDIEVLDMSWMGRLMRTLGCHELIGTAAFNFEPVKYPRQEYNCASVSIKNGNVGGACILIPKTTENKIGNWKEDFEVYGEEDGDYWWRLRAAGLHNAYVWSEEQICKHIGNDDNPTDCKDPEYRKHKDDCRKRNYEKNIVQKNIEGYSTGKIPYYFKSNIKKILDSNV